MGWGEAIQAIVAIAGAASSRSGGGGKALSYDQAYNIARNELGSNWNKTLEKTLSSLKNNQIARGVYGQLSSDALTRSTAADIESQKNASIASLASSLQSNSQTRADAARQEANSALLNAGSQFANLLSNSNYSVDWSKLFKKGQTNSEDGSTTAYTVSS